MAVVERLMAGPQRWDVPFGENMTPQDVARLLRVEPFSSMDPHRFPKTLQLPDILLNDTRVMNYRDGDIVVREGDYGSSAFLILRGSARVVLESLPPQLLGRRKSKRQGILATIAKSLTRSQYPETRHYGATEFDAGLGSRGNGVDLRVFLQDVPGVLSQARSLQLAPGEIFGELAALSRMPRSATVIAGPETALLEIRWQGLREMMRRTPALKQWLDRLYRQNSLESHLRATPLLSGLFPENLQQVAAATEFQSYGDFEWQAEYRKIRVGTTSERLDAEPKICEEGHYTNDLILIRGGFARLSRQYGDGHRTLAYLGKGDVYGLEELVFNSTNKQHLPLQRSLRAVGHVDILRIPASLVEQLILPTLSRPHIQRLRTDAQAWATSEEKGPLLHGGDQFRDNHIDTGLLEFLLDERFMNGTQTMLINTDRCTRCDDCVRACAATHDNNPRFVRHGPQDGPVMIANACMHCVDPVCMIGCPTGAIGRDGQTGNVVINDATCIGCSTCANSCPYHNIRMVEIRDDDGAFILDDEQGQPIVKATKCDLCVDNLGGPACQRACPHDAMVRIDMTNVAALSRWLHR
jgi:Fe-S-cluster-containing dehydrogenase component/CRP-like cAMP-binding protein